MKNEDGDEMTWEEIEDEAIEALRAIHGGDQESAHGQADDELLKFLRNIGAKRVADEWSAVAVRCGGFWYA